MSTFSQRHFFFHAFIVLIIGLTGCASQGRAERERNPDPFEPANRAIYRINDIGDRYVAKPVAKAYERMLPRAFRLGANNFLENLRYPITIVNDFLQGKVRQGGADIARFAINSTVGLLGIFDPATEIGLRANDEDFGQTLAVWGVPQGPYLMVPVFGPYTLTHGLGALVDTQASLMTQYPDSSLTGKVGGWYLVHKRYRILGADEEVQRAFDPYLFIRDAYLQYRRFQIYDGNIPDDDLFPEDDYDDYDD